MNDILTNEITYCAHCGAANKKSAVMCSECEKKLVFRYRPFYDFLKKHTKDEISDVITDTFFSLLKKYLLSHIYGVALSVTIVAATASAVYSVAPHVEKIKTEEPPVILSMEEAAAKVEETAAEDPEEMPVEAETEEIKEEIAEETAEETPEETEEKPVEKDTTVNEYLINDLQYVMIEYDSFVDTKRSSEPFWDYRTSPYKSVSEMYAEKNIPGYSYSAVHEMISNPINIYPLDLDSRFDEYEFVAYTSDRSIIETSVKKGENCTTSLAKKLLADGYTVAEADYIISETASLEEEKYSYETHSGADYAFELVYRFVFVEYNNDWYIAEDRLIRRNNP